VLATHNGHDQLGVLPPVVAFWWSNPAYTGGYTNSDGTFFYCLLPYYEQGVIQSNISNWPGSGLGQLGATNKAAMSIPIKTLIAPHDPTGGGDVAPGLFSADWMWQSATDVALCSYACNFQVFGRPGTESSIWGWHNTHGQKKLTDITDGTSNTLFIAEKRKGCGPNGTPNKSNTWGTAWGHPAEDAFWPTFARINSWWTDDKTAAGYNLFPVPQVTPTNAQCETWQFRAQGHSTSGTMVGLGDGSVRTVNRSITELTWSFAVLPSDGNVLGGDW